MTTEHKKIKINEDWWAVIIAFIIILFTAIGLLDTSGIQIKF